MGVESIRFRSGDSRDALARKLELLRQTVLNGAGATGPSGPIAIADVDGLTVALAAKQAAGFYAATGHNHDGVYATAGHNHAGVYQPAGSYAAAGHGHGIADVTGLQTALDGKQASGSYALSGHNHDAAYAAAGHTHSFEPVIAAGTTAQYWRGDKTWQTLPAGSDPWTYLKLAADFVCANSTVLGNVNDGTTTLTFTPPANTDWELEGRMLVWTTTATNLPRVGFSVAAGATRGYGGVNLWQAGATATTAVQANGAWNNAAGITVAQIAAGGVLTASVPYICEIIAAGRSGAAPTAITIQAACETAAANVCFIKRGSFIKYRTF